MKANFLIRYMLLVSILVSFVQACSGTKTEQPPMKTVKLKVLSMPYLTFAPFFIAQEEGYFSEQGLEIEFVQFDSLSQAIPALVQGELDVVSGHIRASIFSAITGGAPIKIVADKCFVNPAGCSDTAFLASKSLVEDGKLDNPSQTAGRKVSVDLTNYEGYFLDQILGPAGLTIDDVTLVEDIPSATQSDAFGSGAVDVLFAAEPWLTRIQNGGNAVMWIAPKDIIPDFEYGVIAYGPSLLTDNPEAGKRFMVAYLKGVQRYNQGKTKRNLEILAKYTELDQEILQEACWPSFRQNGNINLQSVLDFQTWAMGKGYLDKIVSGDQIWEPLFVDYANQVLDSAQP